MAGRNAQETHNLYTQILAEAGIQGAVCFAGLLIVVLRKALRLRRRLNKSIADLAAIEKAASPRYLASVREERRTHQFLVAVASSVVVFTISRLVLGMFGHDLMEIYWWIAAGLTMALHSVTAVAESRALDLQRAISDGGAATATT
jgi:O-antigen ligase